MDPLSRRQVLIRYGAVIIVMYIAACLARGAVSLSSLLFIIFVAFMSLKYPFFDAIVRMARRRWPGLKVLPWLWIGYIAAAVTDVVATWMTVGDDTGASLALAASTMFVTPSILIAALLLMALHTLVIGKPHKKRAKRMV